MPPRIWRTNTGGVFGGSAGCTGGFAPRTFLTAAERPGIGAGVARLGAGAAVAAGAADETAGGVAGIGSGSNGGGVALRGTKTEEVVGVTSAFDAAGFAAGAGLSPAGSGPVRDGDISPPDQVFDGPISGEPARPVGYPRILRSPSTGTSAG
jgi:hypothetical protein